MLTVEAVRAALQSLPDAWKRQYEHEVGWPPYRAKMKIHQETTLALNVNIDQLKAAALEKGEAMDKLMAH